MILHHQSDGTFPGGYRSDHVEPWAPGTDQEVSPSVAAYLTSTFPTAFIVRKGTAPDPGPHPDLVLALELPVRDLIGTIRAGAYDARLDELLALEQGGAKRKALVEAIEARLARG